MLSVKSVFIWYWLIDAVTTMNNNSEFMTPQTKWPILFAEKTFSDFVLKKSCCLTLIKCWSLRVRLMVLEILSAARSLVSKLAYKQSAGMTWQQYGLTLTGHSQKYKLHFAAALINSNNRLTNRRRTLEIWYCQTIIIWRLQRWPLMLRISILFWHVHSTESRSLFLSINLNLKHIVIHRKYSQKNN